MTVRSGTTDMVTADGHGLLIDEEPYAYPGSWWEGTDQVWRDSRQPECLPPLSRGAQIEFGTVDVEAADGAVGGRRIVWVRCVSLPASVEGSGDEWSEDLGAPYREALERN